MLLLLAARQVYVPPHPLVKHWLAVCRNNMTPSGMFRSAMAELGRILIYEAVREFLPTMEGVVDTPMGEADVTFVDPTRPIKVWRGVGSVRGGRRPLPMMEGARWTPRGCHVRGPQAAHQCVEGCGDCGASRCGML